MPKRLPRELRILYEVARGVAALESEPAALERLCDEVGRAFGFSSVRFVADDAERDDLVLLDVALEERRAVCAGQRVAVPLLVNGECLGYLVADRGGKPLALSEADVHLLSVIGLVGGVFVAKAQQQEQLRVALDELRRVDELKDEFVSIASHELRAPIAVVYGITATLHARGDELDPAHVAELRDALYEQTLRLRDLTEQLLDLSRLDAGRIQVALLPFRPRSAVEGLVARIAPDRRGDVRIAIEPERELVSDPVAFDRVVGNLISNALKYGRVPVTVDGREVSDRFRIVVEDRGPGVPPEFVPQLFERFTRAGGTTVSGAGLGLAIAHAFAEAVGAEVTYEPAEPSGARFVFALPAMTREARR
jgi:signal transduction histidine kinase